MKLKLTKKRIIIISIITLIILSVTLYLIFFGVKRKAGTNYDIPFFKVNTAWADTTLKYLSTEEKVGQLIYFKANYVTNSYLDSLTVLLAESKPGMVEYTTDSISSFIKINNDLQKISKINLITFLQNEKNIIFKDFIDLPNQNHVNANFNEQLISEWFLSRFECLKTLNIVGSSYISDLLTKQCNATDSLHTVRIKNYLNQAEEKNILVFLNENDFFTQDSAHLNQNIDIIRSGISGIVIKNTSGISENDFRFSQNLRSRYKFSGFIIADSVSLNKDSVFNLFNLGCDLFKTEHPDKLKEILIQLVEEEKISIDQLDALTRKVLLAKTWTGLNNEYFINDSLVNDWALNHKTIKNLRSIFKSSVTLLKNDNQQIPFKSVTGKSITLIDIGNEKSKYLTDALNNFIPVKYQHFNINDDQSLKLLAGYKKTGDVIFAFNQSLIDTTVIKAIKSENKAVTNTLINFGNMNNLLFADSFTTVYQIYGNSTTDQKNAADAYFGAIHVTGKLPICIANSFPYGSGIEALKVRVTEAAPEEIGMNSSILSEIDSIAASAIRNGAFPGCQIVVLKNGYSVYNRSFGYQTYAFDKPVQKNNLYDLASITKIAATTLATMKLFDLGKLRLSDVLGKFFKDRSIDYSNIKPDTIFNIDTLYYKDITDFRRILKYQDTLRLNDSMLIAYDTLIITTTPKNNIFNVTIRELLLHQSGITPTLPILPYILYKKNFYDSLALNRDNNHNDSANSTIGSAKSNLKIIFDKYFTRKYIKDSATVKIADNFYLQNRYFDTLWRDTKRLRVYSRKIYQYSDINMILLQLAVDSIIRTNINDYLRKNFYLPMGLNTMTYVPLKYFNAQSIVPTEYDKYWREQLLRGNVHDPSAAMLGGISGNAGLFSNAYDLAILGQMWLNGGTYGGARYLSESTVKLFTSHQENSHRGLGFDKPSRKSIIGNGASQNSYGHTGFTGTCIWVDPDHKLVFVFLSNRVHPDAKNGRINSMKIRQKIHTTVYKAIIQ